MNIDLNIEIDKNNKTIYIASESSSGVKYTYNNLKDIGNIFVNYLKFYEDFNNDK